MSPRPSELRIRDSSDSNVKNSSGLRARPEFCVPLPSGRTILAEEYSQSTGSRKLFLGLFGKALLTAHAPETAPARMAILATSNAMARTRHQRHCPAEKSCEIRMMQHAARATDRLESGQTSFLDLQKVHGLYRWQSRYDVRSILVQLHAVRFPQMKACPFLPQARKGCAESDTIGTPISAPNKLDRTRRVSTFRGMLAQHRDAETGRSVASRDRIFWLPDRRDGQS